MKTRLKSPKLIRRWLTRTTLSSARLTNFAAALFALALASAGCADGVDDYAQDKNEDGTIGSDVGDGGNGDGGNGDGGNTGDDTKCRESVRRCNENGDVEVCTNGVFVQETCDGICRGGECTPFNDNSCENPTVVAPGETKTLSTNTKNSFVVSNAYAACTSIHKRLAVAKLQIPEFGYYEITATSEQNAPRWGVFESLACTADDFYQNSCLSTSAAKSRVMKRLLSPGELYVFVGGINGKTEPDPFDATIAFKRLEAPQGGACQYAGNLIPVDATHGSYTDHNKTASGVSKAYGIDGGSCQTSSTGNEIGYAFQLTKPQTITAKLQITRGNGEKCGDTIDNRCPDASLHIQKCADESNLNTRTNTVNCARISPTPENASLSLEQTLTPGEYILFVDSNTSNVELGYAYDLTLTFE